MLTLSRRTLILGALAPVFVQRSSAQNVEIRVICSGGFTAAYNMLAPRFEQITGKKVISAYGASMGNAPDAIPQRLARGEPTDITIVNRLREATSIHWHGIELESYSDGVAGWSGNPSLLAPTISPNDSFTARLTLPRAGTFMYHTHLNDIEQLTSGLFGPIIVLEPGQKFDPSTDHVFTAGWDGRRSPAFITINGDSATGPPIELAVGAPHRFRFINIGPAVRLFFAIRRGADVVTWRALAKDGADLPTALAVNEPSIRRLGVGEMYDAEFVAREPGDYFVTVGPPETQLRYKRKIIVR